MRIITKAGLKAKVNEAFERGVKAANDKRVLGCKELETTEFGNVTQVFNFADPNIIVQSVERVPQEFGTANNTCVYGEHTRVGYYFLAEPTKTKEYWFHCTRIQHNNLVEQWTKAKEALNVKKPK